MSKRLTAGAIEKLKPEASRREVPDGGCPGLYLVIQPTGAKSWSLRFRSPVERDGTGQRKAKKLTLGPLAIVPSQDDPKIGHPLTLVQARALATAAMGEVANHRDPTHARREERAKEREQAIRADTIDVASVEFLDRYKGRKKQGLRESTRLLTAFYLGLKRDPENAGKWIKTGGGILKVWSGRPIASITKRDVIQLIEATADKGHGVTANRTLTVLKTFFAWAVKRDMLAASPAAAVDAPAQEQSRDRILSDVELAALWRATEAEKVGSPFKPWIQLLILTAVRRDELREAPWSEFDLDAALWKLPAARVKNNREHVVPLSDMALDILKKMKRVRGGLLFTTTGSTPISGLSGAKERLHDRMVADLHKIDPEHNLKPWTLHDLRRTVASGLQVLGIPIEVVEAVLNHKSGTLRGVAGIYARHDYLPEKTRALQAWAAHVRQVVTGAGADSNVVPLRAAPK
jgi:integrase